MTSKTVLDIIEQKTVFVTSDGEKHDTEAAAIEYQEFLELEMKVADFLDGFIMEMLDDTEKDEGAYATERSRFYSEYASRLTDYMAHNVKKLKEVIG